MKQTRLVLVAMSLLWLVGCSQVHEKPQSMRAIWVTRFDYKTQDDVRHIIKDCAEAGFDTVVFQVRGNGTVFYPSEIEPWAEQFNHKDPGYDPLALALSEARQRNLELHAWVNVMPAWRGPSKPDIPNQLYNTHPEWFWYDANGNRQPLLHRVGDQSRSWYVSLNPCLPEVRAYLTELFKEIVENYDLDGLHLDYIRFPNEAVVDGEIVPDYPRDPRTLALYKEETGLAPDDNDARWRHWRSEQVTSLVADIREMMSESRPDAMLSASVGSVPSRAIEHFQDSFEWIDRGLLDAVMPMNYCNSLRTFEERNAAWLSYRDRVLLVPGWWIDQKMNATEAAEVASDQVESAFNRTGSYCLFSYALLFDPPGKDLPPGHRGAETRAQRREILIPQLLRLSRSSEPHQAPRAY